jgi:hypothetical protein
MRKISKDLSIMKKADILFDNIIFLSRFSKKFNHSMLSSNNKTFHTYDNKKKIKLKEILHCNRISKTTKSGCSKGYVDLYIKEKRILIKPDYLEIKKLIPKLKKTKLQDTVIKEMSSFVNTNIKLNNMTNNVSRLFRKCQIPKSKLLTKKVNFVKKKSLVCHEAVILSWRRGLYKYLQTIYKDEKIILEKVNKIMPLDSKKCILDFSRYLVKTPYWNKFIIFN